MEQTMLSEFVFKTRYAKFDPAKSRRETWIEAVDRMMDMHKTKFPQMSREIEECRAMAHEKRITGSQRALQMGGEAILERNARLFNCASSYADRPRFFAEYLWLLMSGCGAGFSIQSHHVSRLPSIQIPAGSTPHLIGDSAEGFADAVDALCGAYFYGRPRPRFEYDAIRPAGSKLRFGGTAPGAEPLRRALTCMEEVLCERSGEQLRPYDVFRCAMYLAESVGKGGTRRCATIATFDIGDELMLKCKTGNWWTTHPEFQCANISAVAVRATVQREQFDQIFQYTREFGEPAVIFQTSTEFTFNPCVEALMCPMLIQRKGDTIEHYTLDLIDPARRAAHEAEGFTFTSGWQLCNLSSINVRMLKSKDDFKAAARAAAILGTLQSAYTDLGYLGGVSRQIVERENLLGVSLCGVMDAPHLALDPETLEEMATLVKEVNEEIAAKIGVRPSSRMTLEKPEGTTSLVFETCAGLHTRHGKRYIRRVSCDSADPVLQHFAATNPHAVQSASYPVGAKVLAFAEEAPAGALTRSDVSAVDFLKKARTLLDHWVTPGARARRLEGGSHNVSMTVSVRAGEWDAVQDFLWDSRHHFGGVSFLEMGGDYVFENPPFQEVQEPTATSTPAERSAWEYWRLLRDATRDVDYSTLIEQRDETAAAEEIACGGGKCLL
jgi:ribonucleoside-diphosphate reductase alpha chain